MNQEPGDCVATYLGLRGFAVVAVELVQHPQRGWVKLVRIERQDGQHKCPECGRRQAAGLFAEREPIGLRDGSIGGWETCLEVRPMRIACCRGTRVERLPLAMPGFRMTRRFFERLADPGRRPRSERLRRPKCARCACACRGWAGRAEAHSDGAEDARSLYFSLDLRRIF
jgi:hypothetical protein